MKNLEVCHATLATIKAAVPRVVGTTSSDLATDFKPRSFLATLVCVESSCTSAGEGGSKFDVCPVSGYHKKNDTERCWFSLPKRFEAT
jgi:hypothetical protein